MVCYVKMMISPSPAGSWVMAQHWGGLHATTVLFHNWLVSQRARTCHHADRLRLQQLPQTGTGMLGTLHCILSNLF